MQWASWARGRGLEDVLDSFTDYEPRAPGPEKSRDNEAMMKRLRCLKPLKALWAYGRRPPKRPHNILSLTGYDEEALPDIGFLLSFLSLSPLKMAALLQTTLIVAAAEARASRSSRAAAVGRVSLPLRSGSGFGLSATAKPGE